MGLISCDTIRFFRIAVNSFADSQRQMSRFNHWTSETTCASIHIIRSQRWVFILVSFFIRFIILLTSRGWYQERFLEPSRTSLQTNFLCSYSHYALPLSSKTKKLSDKSPDRIEPSFRISHTNNLLNKIQHLWVNCLRIVLLLEMLSIRLKS